MEFRTRQLYYVCRKLLPSGHPVTTAVHTTAIKQSHFAWKPSSTFDLNDVVVTDSCSSPMFFYLAAKSVSSVCFNYDQSAAAAGPWSPNGHGGWHRSDWVELYASISWNHTALYVQILEFNWDCHCDFILGYSTLLFFCCDQRFEGISCLHFQGMRLIFITEDGNGNFS